MLKHGTVPTGPSIRVEFFSDGLNLDFDREKDYDYWFNSLRTKGRKNFSNLISQLIQTHQILVPWFVPVAKQHNLPCAVLWIHPCALYSIYYRFFNKLNPFPIFQNPDQPLQLPGLPSLDLADLPSFIIPNAPLCFQTLLSEFFAALGDVKWVLGTSFQELEEEVLESMGGGVVRPTVMPVGPLVSRFLLGKEEGSGGERGWLDMWKADERCLEWLDGKELGSVVYVSFGSVIVLGKEEVENIGNGLLMSGKPFLWVLKASTVELSDGFLQAVAAGRGLVVGWCSQEQVLKHKAVGCFLTHCGWNSTLETVVTGVPVIAFPEWTDQPTNAKLRKGDNGVVSSKDVDRCIREITDDGPAAEAITKRAAELKAAAGRALEDGGSSSRNLDLFISDIISNLKNK